MPRIDARQGRTAANPEVSEPIQATETILVVEDLQALREMIQEVLQEQGYTVITAATGQAALEMASQHQGPLDLLLTDLILPGMNGRELAERLAALRPATRTLYMSGYSDGSAPHQDARSADATLIEKPFSFQALAQAVRQALEEP
jgi:CheY-like chemotaxis protein